MNCWVWPAVNADDEGVTATTVGELGASITRAVPEIAEFDGLVAVTVTACGADTLLGGVYRPAGFRPPTCGVIDHVTSWLGAPERAAENCC